MSSAAHSERLANALNKTGALQSVQQNYREGQVSIIFRVLAGGEPHWMEIVHKLLLASERNRDQGWKIDISKPYLLKNEKVVYGWRLSVMAEDMSFALDQLTPIIRGENTEVQVSRFELDSMPMTGMEGTADRNAPRPGSKKGVYSGGTVPIDRR